MIHRAGLDVMEKTKSPAPDGSQAAISRCPTRRIVPCQFSHNFFLARPRRYAVFNCPFISEDRTYLHISAHICTYLHISARICTYLHISAHICTYLHISAHICTYLHISAHICTYLHISAHICTYLHISAHICTYLHVYAHICTYLPEICLVEGQKNIQSQHN